MNIETRSVVYVFADVEDFTVDRTNEAQVAIIMEINEAFLKAAEELKLEGVTYLPTGDGICACIVEPQRYDAHLRMALKIIAHVGEWSEMQTNHNRKCRVRIGINDHRDCFIKDILGRDNFAGEGINHTQRLMSIADGNQIIAGETVYRRLKSWDAYENAFMRMHAGSKHGQIVTGYLYDGPEPFLNKEKPAKASQTDEIEVEMAAEIQEGNNSHGAVRRALWNARKKWEVKIASHLYYLEQVLPIQQLKKLQAAQKEWEAFAAAEGEFVSIMRKTAHGNHFGSFSAENAYDLYRRRALILQQYLEHWSVEMGPPGVREELSKEIVVEEDSSLLPDAEY